MVLLPSGRNHQRIRPQRQEVVRRRFFSTPRSTLLPWQAVVGGVQVQQVVMQVLLMALVPLPQTFL